MKVKKISVLICLCMLMSMVSILFGGISVSAADTLKIEVESFNSSSGGLLLTADGNSVAGTNSGKWSRYNNVDFGVGFQKLNVRFAQNGDSWIGQGIKVYVVESGANFDIANPPTRYTECFINRNTSGAFVEKAEIITIDPNDAKIQYYAPGLVNFRDVAASGVKDVIIAYTPGQTWSDSGIIDWIEFSVPKTYPPTLELEAEIYDSVAAGIAKKNYFGQECIEGTTDKTYARYNNIDFGSGYTNITFQYSQNNDTWYGPRVFVYAVTPGAATDPLMVNDGSSNLDYTLLGNIFLDEKSPNNFVTKTLNFTAITGVKDIFLVFRAGADGWMHAGRIDYFKFAGYQAPPSFEVKSIAIKSSDNQAITEIKNLTSIKAVATYVNPTSSDENLTIVAALYKKVANDVPQLIKVACHPLVAGANSAEQSSEVILSDLPANINNTTNEYYVKAFVVNDFSTLKPLLPNAYLN